MRNLLLLLQQHQLIPNVGTVQDFVVDEATQRIFVLTADGKLLVAKPEDNKILTSVQLDNFISPNATVVGLSYVPDLKLIFFATNEGDLVTCDPLTGQVEVIGTVSSSILAVSWSPDFEIVLFVTDAPSIISMSQEWEVLSEVPLTPDEEPPSSAQAKPTPPAKPDLTIQPKISWRDDGEYFSVATWENETSRFRVWQRACVLSSASEPLSRQEHQLAWRTSIGDLIASSQILPHKHDIIFFERNGLRHGDFSLRMGYDVRDITWSPAADLLGLLLTKPDTKESVIQLWSRGNYHWYLKYEFTRQNILKMIWEKEKPMSLHLLSVDGTWENYIWCWEVNVTTGLSENNYTTVGVIDGTSVGYTPFQKSVVPPPMSMSKLTLKDNVLEICFGPQNQFLTLSNGDVVTCELPTTAFGKPPAVLSVNSCPYKLRQKLAVSKNEFLAIQYTDEGDRITQFGLQENTFVPSATSPVTQKRILRLFGSFETPNKFIQLSDGTVFQVFINADAISFSPSPFCVFPSPCEWVQAITMESTELIAGLTSRNKLYINTTLVSTECSSFMLHSEFFFFTTTTTNALRLMSLAHPLSTNLQILQQNRKYDSTTREIEVGAILVGVVPHGTRVVLQMPRGTLETIEPLALVLSFLRKSLNEKRYAESFHLMRRNRVNLNFIYDHNPAQFKENLGAFVKEVATVDFLNLFITDLKNDDMSLLEYKDPWGEIQTTSTGIVIRSAVLPFLEEDSAVQNKVNLICSLLLAYFEENEADKYFLCTLTALVKIEPSRVETALNLVQKLKRMPLTVSNASNLEFSEIPPVWNEAKRFALLTLTEDPQQSKISWESALKYLIFLVDVNKLYKIALGMYDFDLVLLVATKSQMDPKEYLPFLAGLQRLDTFVQRYQIDTFLERWEKALANLIQAGEEHEKECLQLIETHNLYNAALSLLTGPFLASVQDAYATKLSQNKNYVAAGLLWTKCGKIEQAIGAYQHCGHWKKVMYLANSISLPEDKIRELAQQMAEELMNNFNYNESAIIYDQYLQNPEQAVAASIKSSNFEEALRIAHKYKRVDLIDSEMKPAIEKYWTDQSARITTKALQFREKYNRLLTIRYEKLTAPVEDPDALEDWANSDTASMYSMESGASRQTTGTWASTSTRGSKASKGKKKKPAKKKLSGRKGNPYEQEYLISELANSIPSVHWQEEIKDLLRLLVYFDMREQAIKLQNAFKAYIALVQSGLPLLNTPKLLNEEEQETERTRALRRKEQPHPELIHPTTTVLYSIPDVKWALDVI